MKWCCLLYYFILFARSYNATDVAESVRYEEFTVFVLIQYIKITSFYLFRNLLCCTAWTRLNSLHKRQLHTALFIPLQSCILKFFPGARIKMIHKSHTWKELQNVTQAGRSTRKALETTIKHTIGHQNGLWTCHLPPKGSTKIIETFCEVCVKCFEKIVYIK